MVVHIFFLSYRVHTFFYKEIAIHDKMLTNFNIKYDVIKTSGKHTTPLLI